MENKEITKKEKIKSILIMTPISLLFVFGMYYLTTVYKHKKSQSLNVTIGDSCTFSNEIHPFKDIELPQSTVTLDYLTDTIYIHDTIYKTKIIYRTKNIDHVETLNEY